jgi:glycosyltransferase involved in cell wall biosynthesis
MTDAQTVQTPERGEENLTDMRILQVSTYDIAAGGAESVAWHLFQKYRRLGHASWLAVCVRNSDDQNVFLFQQGTPRNLWHQLCMAVAGALQPLVGRVKGVGRAQHIVKKLSQPLQWLRWELGHEVFAFSGTECLLDLLSKDPEIIHCHNLHSPNIPGAGGSGYFDLRILPELSQRVPVILTIHDEWLLSGHCAYTLGCERWKMSCGHCPDLTINPAIQRDATAYNWRRKREIYAKSRLYVATPSRWLMQRVEQSILSPAIVEGRIIPYGVDLSIFHPVDSRAVRATLSIPQDTMVLLFTANNVRQNRFKDYQTIRTAVAQVAERLCGQDMLLLALGADAPAEQIGKAKVRFIAYQKDPRAVARYYQAADLCLHAAKADNFPNTVLEALACGKPVVATAVGGIPEQLKGLQSVGCRMPELNRYEMNEATGVLVPPGDTGGMAASIAQLLTDKFLCRSMGENAARDARERFDLQRQAHDYLEWYEHLRQAAALSTK